MGFTLLMGGKYHPLNTSVKTDFSGQVEDR